jgi:hypothetical protein
MTAIGAKVNRVPLYSPKVLLAMKILAVRLEAPWLRKVRARLICVPAWLSANRKTSAEPRREQQNAGVLLERDQTSPQVNAVSYVVERRPSSKNTKQPTRTGQGVYITYITKAPKHATRRSPSHRATRPSQRPAASGFSTDGPSFSFIAFGRFSFLSTASPKTPPQELETLSEKIS